MGFNLKAIKIHDWNVEKATPIPQEGEDNAVVVSFRIANIIGEDVFLAAWDSIKKNIVPIENFNAISLVMGICKVVVDIYSALKAAKKSQV